MSTPLLTPKEVAAELRVSERQVVRMARDGRLPSVRVGRFHRFEPTDVADYRVGRRTSKTPPVQTLGQALGQVTKRKAS